MEFAMEGYRLLDLLRWGIASEYLNAYFNVERNGASHLRMKLMARICFIKKKIDRNFTSPPKEVGSMIPME